MGSDRPAGFLTQREHTHTHIVANMSEMDGVYQQHSSSPSVDVLELCGGEGRCATIALRRKLQSGGNLDIVIGTDLANSWTQEEVIH